LIGDADLEIVPCRIVAPVLGFWGGLPDGRQRMPPGRQKLSLAYDARTSRHRGPNK
jgi:hypothetical protein